MTPTRRLIRAAGIGLTLALLISGATLALTGWIIQKQRTDCAGLAAEECVLEQQLARDIGRFQLRLGVGLLGTSLGLGLLVRLLGRDARAHEHG